MTSQTKCAINFSTEFGTLPGTNQIIEPRDFIDVVTVESNDERWVKLIVWGIERSDRYGANTRIYGEIHNTILGVLEDTRLQLAAIDLARLKDAETVKQHITEERKLTLKAITCNDSEIEMLIKDLTKAPEVEDLAYRRNQVDVLVDEYFRKTVEQVGFQLPDVWKKWKPDERLDKLNSGQPKKSQYELARLIEGTVIEEVEEEVATT